MRGRTMRKLRNLALGMLAVIVCLGEIGLAEAKYMANTDEKINTQETSTSLPTLVNSKDLVDSLPQTIDKTNKTTEETIESEEIDKEKNEQDEQNKLTLESEILLNEENDASVTEQSTEDEDSEATKKVQSRAIQTVGDWQIKTPPSVPGYTEIVNYLGSDKTSITIPRDLDGTPTLLTQSFFKNLTSANQTKYLSVNEIGSPIGAQLYGDLNGSFNYSSSNSQWLSIDLSNTIAPLTAVGTLNMFGGLTQIQTIKLPKGMKTTDTRYMFAVNSKLTDLDLNGLDTSEVTYMNNMFQGCNKLEKLDLRSFDTSKVINMSDMFNGMKNLIDLDVSSFNTSEVIDMSNMFQNMLTLSNIDLSSFNTSKVQSMTGMFYGNNNLEIVDSAQFVLKDTINANSLFGSQTKAHPLLLIADDPILLSTQPSTMTNGLKIFELSIEANGGRFADGSLKKSFFNSIAITSDQAKTLLPDIKQYLADNVPTRSSLAFEGWEVTQGIHVNEINDIHDLVETSYKAVWKTPVISSVPSELSFSSKLNKGPMSIGQVINGDTPLQNRLVFFAEASGPKDWHITGQLKWDGNAIPNSRLVTTSNSKVYMSTQPDGSRPSGHNSDVISNLNMTISTVPTPVVEIKSIAVSNYYMIELGTISLAIDNGEAVIAGTYSGSINWDFNFTPS